MKSNPNEKKVKSTLEQQSLAQQGLEPRPLAFALQNVCAAIGDRLVLRNVNAEIKAARWVSIVGPNGAGKSTLLKVLAHLLPCQGGLDLLGRKLATYSAKQRAQLVAWLGQNETVADDMNAYDVVMLGRMPYQGWLSSASAQDHAQVEQAMVTTHTWHYRARTLGELSGGERQRVLLARVLAAQAPIILMDEPLANLDPPHQTQWLRDIRQLVAQGTTVISVLHEIPIALFSDEMIVMQEGQIFSHAASASELTHAALEKVFDQQIRICSVEGQWVAIPNVA